MQRGVIHLIIPIIAGFLVLAGLGLYMVRSKSIKPAPSKDSVSQNEPPGSPAAHQNNSENTQISQKPTSVPTSAPTPTSVPIKKSVCTVVTNVSDSNPMSLKLIYSVSSSNNAYMTAAQWDFNNDGTWDTDFTLQNGTVTHTFPSSGSHSVKLQLKMSDGEVTEPCYKVVTVPQGISVTFSGKVFSDKNCNNVWDTNEQFIQGITVNIFRQPGNNLFKTLTTDSGGNFSFTSNISDNEILTITPGAQGTLDPPYYKIFYNAPSYTLNNSNRNASTTLSIIPAENVGSCPI